MIFISFLKLSHELGARNDPGPGHDPGARHDLAAGVSHNINLSFEYKVPASTTIFLKQYTL